MSEKRKDYRGRVLRTGEYYDYNNQRYMFRKMLDGERITITAQDLAELRVQENELLCKIDKGNKLNIRNSKMLLNEYFDFWFETFARSGRKATTCTNYKAYYNAHVKDTIGKKQISKITKVDCQHIINKMIEDGKRHSTMANLKSCLNAIFECAMDDNIIEKNPARNLKLPYTESEERTPIKRNQIDLFMAFVKNSGRYSFTYPAFVVLFNLGVRIGEMAALTWKDVNFKENTITINKTVNRYRKADFGFTVAVASPKSRKSVRKILMNSITKNVLLKEKMHRKSSTASLPYVDDYGNRRREITEFIFLNTQGMPWNEPSFLDLIKRIVICYNKEAEKNGTEKIEDFCPHRARHTYTSLAYEAGADVKMVSQILGHASTSVTLDTYTHLTEDKKKEQNDVIQTIKIS